MQDFFKELGWLFLRLVLGLPTVFIGNALVLSWRNFFNPLLLPIVGRDRLDYVVVLPFLALLIVLWMATIKLAELVFRFRFPSDS